MNNQKFFSSIIDSMPSALIAVDASLLIKHINKNALTLCNSAIEDVLNIPVTSIFPMLEQYGKDILSSLSNGNTVTLEKVEYSNDDLNNYYQVTCYPLTPIPEVIVIQIDDVTQRELLEQRVLHTEKMHSMDGLAAGIAHEVNNPLSAIINGAQNITRRLEPDRSANQEIAKELGVDLDKINTYLEQREIKFFLESIEEGALRASNIVSNMLRFSSSEVYSREPCNINLLLEQAIKFVKKDYELNNERTFNDIQVETILDPSLPLARVLPMELQQVFVNLFRNAEQAITARASTLPEAENYKGKLTIETKLDQGTVKILISDNGCGMDETVMRKAFDHYFTTRKKTGGHGLGLSTVYRIVKSQLQGEIELRSSVNIGSQFIISLND